MAKNHKADISNANKGTSGQNDAYKARQENRANQLNPNNPEHKGKK